MENLTYTLLMAFLNVWILPSGNAVSNEVENANTNRIGTSNIGLITDEFRDKIPLPESAKITPNNSEFLD